MKTPFAGARARGAGANAESAPLRRLPASGRSCRHAVDGWSWPCLCTWRIASYVPVTSPKFHCEYTCIRKLRSNRPDAEIFTPDRSDRHGPAVAVAGCSRGMLTVSAIIEQAVEECGLAVETQRTKLCKRTWAFERRTRRGHREPAAGSESARRQRPRATGRTAVRWLSNGGPVRGLSLRRSLESLGLLRLAGRTR